MSSFILTNYKENIKGYSIVSLRTRDCPIKSMTYVVLCILMVQTINVTYGNTYCLFQMATFLYLGGYRNNTRAPSAPPAPYAKVIHR